APPQTRRRCLLLVLSRPMQARARAESAARRNRGRCRTAGGACFRAKLRALGQRGNRVSATVQIVAGRSCKGCTLCCKVLAISELEKPRAVWCKHCDVKAGCKIHGAHPSECKGFYCGYLTNAALDERWAPVRSKIVLAYDELSAPRLSVHV